MVLPAQCIRDCAKQCTEGARDVGQGNMIQHVLYPFCPNVFSLEKTSQIIDFTDICVLQTLISSCKRVKHYWQHPHLSKVLLLLTVLKTFVGQEDLYGRILSTSMR